MKTNRCDVCGRMLLSLFEEATCEQCLYVESKEWWEEKVDFRKINPDDYAEDD